MERSTPFLTSRRLTILSVIFGLFVLFDIFLFGWLLFNSLSRRELDKVMAEMRQQVEPLADALEREALDLGNEDDLYVVVTAAQETRTYIQSVLSQREIVSRVEVHDREGKVVFGQSNTQVVPIDPGELPQVATGEVGDNLAPPRMGSDALEERVPIGDLGTLVIGLREEAVEERIEALRKDLIRQTSAIGALTVSLLAFAYAAIWFLFRRARRLEEQTIDAERMAYIGTLASGLAHEIRNPLNSLNLNLQMLQEEAQEEQSSPALRSLKSSTHGRLLAITRSELNRLEHLVTDFLAYAKPRPLALEEVAIEDLLERVRQVLGSEVAAHGATLEIDDRTGGLKICVDPHQFVQLLLNLTQNSLAATEGLDRPQIQLLARRRYGEAVIEVIDNGRGIPPDEVEKVFDIFFSTRKGGTGLGLAIVKRIAKDHHVKVEIDSAIGEGTTVRLLVPLKESRDSLTGVFRLDARGGLTRDQ